MLNPASTRVETGRVAKEKRLWFRALVQAHVSTLDALTKPSFPGTLELVSGHVMLYGWYLAVFEALDAGGPAADEWNYMLWQAGLTVSIHAQVVTNPADLAALSLKASNDVATVFRRSHWRSTSSARSASTPPAERECFDAPWE